jgi:capsular exopolysaccharide synthesis family protein
LNTNESKGKRVEIDLRDIMRAARRWGWLILAIALLAGAVGYGMSSRQTPMYAATTSILVNPNRATTETEFTQVQASLEQAETYRLLIESGPVLDRVVKEMDLAIGKLGLSEAITTTVFRDTQLIEIEVVNQSPEQAAQIANTLSTQFVDYVEELTVSRLNANLVELESEVAALQTQRQEIDSRLAELDTDASEDDAAAQREMSQLRDERTRIDQTLADLDSAVRHINRQIATSTAPVEVADPAEVPVTPYAPRVVLMTLLGLIVGLMVAAGVVALLELLDRSVKEHDDIPALTGGLVLSSIGNAPKLAHGRDALFAVSNPRSAAAEATRLLRTNLEFAASTSPISSLTMTSPGPDEGKSTITANLGVVLAQAGARTLVIDADLRKPSQHEVFGIDNAAGLTTLLARPDQPWEDLATDGSVPGLRVLTSGPVPPNPADLLGSNRFAETLERIKQDFDIVLIDTSPILAASDALAVASHTDGVVLVAWPGHTKADLLETAAQSIRQGGMRLVGVVLNRVRHSTTTAYYGADFAPTRPSTDGTTADASRPQTAQ